MKLTLQLRQTAVIYLEKDGDGLNVAVFQGAQPLAIGRLNGKANRRWNRFYYTGPETLYVAQDFVAQDPDAYLRSCVKERVVGHLESLKTRPAELLTIDPTVVILKGVPPRRFKGDFLVYHEACSTGWSHARGDDDGLFSPDDDEMPCPTEAITMSFPIDPATGMYRSLPGWEDYVAKTNAKKKVADA